MDKFWCVYGADVYAGEICHEYFKSKDEAERFKIHMEEHEDLSSLIRIRECSFRDSQT